MEVSELPISDSLKNLLIQVRGIRKLYPPQEEAVRKGFFSTRKNFVLATQTASGKTLLAELLLVDNALKRGGIGVYLSPLKALASEKFSDFQIYEKLGVKAALSLGDYDRDDQFLGNFDVIVTTYEKMDSLVRHRPEWLSRVSLVVIDEIHYIDDSDRGPVLESLVAKLRLMIPEVRLIGMSATIGNPKDLAKWLDAELVSSDWRPVPLKQGVFYRDRIMFSDGTEKPLRRVYDHAVLDLVHDALVDGGQALVFVHSRKRALELANFAASRLKIGEIPEARYYAQLLLESSDVPLLNNTLAALTRRGVCFHHAGLSYEQRRIIEEAFREGAIRAIFATPTLSAGVNLPARRVVIEDYRRFSGIYGVEEIKVMEYKQFAGRAGRPGYDEVGEAILIARSKQEASVIMERYIEGEPERIESKLLRERALRSHLLALVATLGPITYEGVKAFFSNTFHGKLSPSLGFKALYEKVLNFLKSNGFVVQRGDVVASTQLGRVVSEVYLDPMTVVIFKNLAGKLPKNISEVSLLYIIAVSPDMPTLAVRRKEEEEIENYINAHYAELVGTLEDAGLLSWEDYLARVKTTMFLSDWINETPEQVLVEKYDLGPGDIRSLTETAEWIAHGLQRVSRYLGEGFQNLADKLSTLEVRIKYGVKEDIIELLSIPGVGRVRARKLYLAGYRRLEDLARAAPAQLRKIEGIGETLSFKIVEEARRLVGASQ